MFFLISVIMVFVSCEKVSGGTPIEGQETAFAMGTAITTTLYGTDEDSIAENLAAVGRSLTSTDAAISWRVSSSFTSVFNERHVVDTAEREDLFQMALQVAEDSGGAFDPTVLSVSKLWDIGGENQRHPSQAEIADALEKVDYRTVSLTDGILETETDGILFELGAVGKGYAIAGAFAEVDREAISAGVLNAGSSILTFGTKPDGSKFRIGLRNPRGAQDDLIGVIEMTDLAIATSGDYEKYFEEDGIRYHHILDARTGEPAQSGLMSVSVISEDSALCDALSTAGFILGLDEGMALMDKYGVLAIFVDNQKNVYYNSEGILDMLSFDGEKYGYTLKAYE